MANKRYPIIIITMFCMLTACGFNDVELGPKSEVAAYDEIVVETKEPPELNIDCDSGNIEVYSWDKKEVKYEMTKHVRGILKKDVLEKKLTDYKIKANQDGNKFYFKSEFKGNIKSPADRVLDLKVFVPKKLTGIGFKVEVGNIKVLDDMRCNFKAETDMVHIDINKFNGKIDVNGKMGNIRIGNGKIAGGSKIVEEMGSINIRAEFENAGEYDFKTNMGNIDLNLPGNSSVSIESVGALGINEFSIQDLPAKVRVYSGMGKINVRKW